MEERENLENSFWCIFTFINSFAGDGGLLADPACTIDYCGWPEEPTSKSTRDIQYYGFN